MRAQLVRARVMDIKETCVRFFISGVLLLIMAGCVPPMRFSNSIDVPAPDGKTNLSVSSVSWTGFGCLIGPEPPRTTSCMGSILGWSLRRGKIFKINIDANFKYSASAQDNIDVLWSPDSKYFAVVTPLDMTIYNKNGDVAVRYALGAKKRISTAHWKRDEEHGLYFVVKESQRDLIPLNYFFHPIGFQVLFINPEGKEREVVFSRSYPASDSFVRNDLGGKVQGQEFQEISPDSRYFIYTDEKMVRSYDFVNGEESILFDSPDSLSWLWWINKHCVLFDYCLTQTTGMQQYIVYNMISGEQKDITKEIISTPSRSRYAEGWYKSLECKCDPSLK